ncbi:MAG: beta/gamma crystallin-related protein [Pseudomonadota bacterium]|jgi:hypothetical protein|uniref:Beta/gamma crystallin family protein n=1 Tax=hydrothermal vent metagenome TaxID=652676 RepID=A0A160TJQ8_9ZZZZ
MKTLKLVALAMMVVAAAPSVAQDRDRDDYRGRDYGPHITVFVDDDFRGRSMEITGPISRLGPTGMEDRISSISVESGRWQVCVDDYYRGRCEVIDRSIGRLTRLGLDDKISSIRPLPRRRWR